MFLKIESYKKGIVISTIFNIINKGFVFLNSLLIAFYFGAQLKIDIYFYAYNTIMIIAVFMTNLNSAVLIPESMRIRMEKGERVSMHFLNLFIYSYLLFTILLFLVFLIDPVHAFIAVSRFKATGLVENSRILALATPLIVLMPIVNLLTDVLTSYKFFTIPMIAGILNGIFSIFFVIFFHKVLNVSSLLFGLLFSYSTNFILLIILMRKKLNWNFEIVKLQIEKRIWKNVGFAQAGNITSSMTSYFPLYLLSAFNPGIISALNFAQQISSLPTVLITNQFSSVAGIKFNELYARRQFQELNETFLSTAKFLLFILTPISGLFFIFSSEIVSLLLKRGAFGNDAVSNTALFLRWLGLLAPTLVINTLFARLFMASHKILQSFWYQIVFNLILLCCIYFCVRQFGPIGYPITWVSAYALNMIFCYFLEKRYFNLIRYNLVLRNFLFIVIANILVALVVYEWRVWIQIRSNLISLTCGGLLYLVLILLMSIRFNLNDHFNLFLHQFWKKALAYARNRRSE
jgi:putative peptidoglycan lipid II flippase